MKTEPVRKINVLVGLLTAASAVVGVLASGGEPLVAVGAGLASLTASLAGGEAIRQKVEPVDLAEDRRTHAVALAEGAVYTEPDDPDAETEFDPDVETAAQSQRVDGPPPVPSHSLGGRLEEVDPGPDHG